MKKARAENVTLKRELHGLLKVQGSVLSTMFKNALRIREAMVVILPSHTELSSDVVTIFNQKLDEVTFGGVSIGHIKTHDSFCAVKKKKHCHHFNAIFKATVLQSLVGCDYFPYVFGVFDGKLVMELITFKDNKVVTVSSLKMEYKLTSANWNVICFSLAPAAKSMHLKNLLCNHLKSNDVLLKLRNNVWISKLADVGKVTLKSNQKHIN